MRQSLLSIPYKQLALAICFAKLADSLSARGAARVRKLGANSPGRISGATSATSGISSDGAQRFFGWPRAVGKGGNRVIMRGAELVFRNSRDLVVQANHYKRTVALSLANRMK